MEHAVLSFLTSFLQLLTTGAFLVLPVLGCWRASGMLKGQPSLPDRIVLSSVFFSALALFSFGVLGAWGKLNFQNALILNSLLGLLFFLVPKKKPAPETREWLIRDKFLLALCTGHLLFRMYYAASLHSGTDSFMYHLFYPAVWIQHERIFAVSLMDLPVEYYPPYGEMLFGFLMLPWHDVSLAILLQTAAFCLASAALYSFAREFGFSRTTGLCAVHLLLCTGLIAENMSMGYTDTLNGSFLLTGICLLLTALKKNSPGRAVLAGLTLGISSGIKYTGLMLSPLLSGGLLLYFLIRNRKKQWKNALIFAAAAFFSASFAYIPNILKTGNPFYPVRIRLFGIPLFSAGIDEERVTAGFHWDRLKFLWNDPHWDMSIPTVILYALLPVLALTILLLIRRRGRFFRYWLMPVPFLIAGLAILQLQIYPVMAQARQYVPLLMVSGLLALPVFEFLFSQIRNEKLRNGLVPVLLILLLWFKGYTLPVHLNPLLTILIVTLLFFFLTPRKWIARMPWAAVILLILLLPFLAEIRYASTPDANRFFAGKTAAAAVAIIQNARIETGRKDFTVANAGGWQNYLFLQDMPGNRVVYVPVCEKNSTHAHEFGSFEAVRKPYRYEVWLKRLKKEKVSYLFVSASDRDAAVMPEKLWADGHPEVFEKLLSGPNEWFYQVRE